MKTSLTTPATNNTPPAGWVTVPVAARCLRCSNTIIYLWGRAGRFGYSQIRPKMHIVNLQEAIAFYKNRFPNVELDLEAIDSVMQSTA